MEVKIRKGWREVESWRGGRGRREGKDREGGGGEKMRLDERDG